MPEIIFQRDEWNDQKASHIVPGEFEFKVEVEDKDYLDKPIEPKLSVSLPHQCDSWDIAWEVKTKEEAKAALRQLIREAHLAIRAVDAAPMEKENDGS